MLEDAAKRQNLVFSDLTKPEFVNPLIERLNVSSFDDIYAAIDGGMSASQVLHKLQELKRKTTKPIEIAERIRHGDSEDTAKSTHVPVNGIIVKGDPGMAVRFGNCCNPLPGDPIGYITRGRGVPSTVQIVRT
ncbi:MAG: hypothetical protein R2881_02475 [Eubacteriales bacterium]